MVEIIAKNDGEVKDVMTCEGAIVISGNDAGTGVYNTSAYCIGVLSFPTIINAYMRCAVAQVKDVVESGRATKLRGINVLYDALKVYMDEINTLLDGWDKGMTESDRKEIEKVFEDVISELSDDDDSITS